MGQVKRSEVYQDNFYGPLAASAKDARVETTALTKDLIAQADVLQGKLNKAMFNNVKGINSFLKLVKKANTLKKQAIDLDKSEVQAIKNKTIAEVEAGKIKRDKLKTEAQEIRNAALLERQKRAQANAEKRATKIARDESDAYKRLSKQTREQKNESKRLAAEMIRLNELGKRHSPIYRKVADDYRKVTASARQGDKALKRIDQTVGDSFRNVGNYGSALDKLKSSFGRIAGALGLFTAVRGITGIVVDFDQAVADLGAVSSTATEKELEKLTAQAKELGATTQFSATQITEMQIELSKLGFEANQIESSTAAVSNFAAATGAEIPAAAKLAGSAMRGFGLDADEMERVVSTLGVATTKTALNFQFLETGLSTVAPVAKAFGFSIEDSTALLGQLANAGFDASSAATATRNILLNLADANGDLAKELGRPIKTAEDLAAGLKELDERGIDLASALELTDKRSVAAFNTFIDGADSLGELKTSITDVNDELEDMAEKRLDTIAGQFTLLKSAFEGYILGTTDAAEATEKIKDAIATLTEYLPSILDWVGRLVKLFLVYKTRLIALRVAQKLFNDGSGKMSINMRTLIKNFKDGAKAGEGFGGAMKAIGWSALIGLALQLANTFIDIANGADIAAAEIEKYNSIKENSTKATNANIDAIRGEIEEYRKQQELLVANGTITADIANENIKAFIKQERFLKSASKSYKDFGGAAVDVYGDFAAQVDELIKAQEREIDLADQNIRLLKTQGEFKNRLKIAEEKALVTNAKDQIEILKAFKLELKEQNFQLDVAIAQHKKFTRSGASAAGTQEKINTEFKNSIDLLKELNDQTDAQIQLAERLRQARSSGEISETQDLIDSELIIQKMRIETERTFDITEVKRLIKERQQLEIESIKSRADLEIQQLEQASAARFAKMREDLASEREILISQAGVTDAQLLEIEKNFLAEMEKIRLVEEADQMTLDENKVAIKEEANNEIIDNERQTAAEIHDINLELTSDLADLMGEDAENAKKSEDEKVKAAAEAAKRRKELAKTLTTFLDKESDKRIAQIDKEIAAREAQVDYYQELAKEGNIKQEQSIKAQEKAINDLEKRRAAEERAKQRRQLINTTYSVYQSHVEAGEENPLAETVTDISLLQALISTIPSFDKGIENTGSHGQGLDGKGGFLSMLHPFERVVDEDNNSKIPDGMTNSDLAQLAQDKERGKLMYKAEINASNGSNWETAALIGEVKAMRKAYENAPDVATKVEQLSDDVAFLITNTRRGNKTIQTRRRINLG